MTRSAIVIVVAAMLGGCGFQPLYGDALGVSPALSSIAVETPPTRTGHLLREELEDEFVTDRSITARYRLIVDLQERRFPRGLRIDDTANRYEQRVTATYRLLDAHTRKVIVRGVRPVSVTYDVADAPYAGVIASLDGQERAASEAARVIRTEVARALVSRPPATRATAAR